MSSPGNWCLDQGISRTELRPKHEYAAPVLTRDLAATLPAILEIKRKLSGEEKRFNCRVLERSPSHLVVLFIARVDMNVHGVILPAGTATFGHFWSDRPYNVYHWLRPEDGTTIGYYVNLADETQLAEDTLEWRDMVVDVLVSADGRATVLDEDELPADLAPSLGERIAAARARVLAELPELLDELELTRAELLRRLSGQPAGSAGSIT